MKSLNWFRQIWNDFKEFLEIRRKIRDNEIEFLDMSFDYPDFKFYTIDPTKNFKQWIKLIKEEKQK